MASTFFQHRHLHGLCKLVAHRGAAQLGLFQLVINIVFLLTTTRLLRVVLIWFR